MSKLLKVAAPRGLNADAVLARLLDAPPAALSADEAAAVLGAFRDAFAALGRDADLADRLGGVSVQIAFTAVDAPEELADDSITVDVAPDGVEADARGHSGAEVRVYLRTADLARLLTGDAQLTVLIAEGRAAYEGPVRRFLRVAPVLFSTIQKLGTPPEVARIAAAPVDPPELADRPPALVDDGPDAALLDYAAAHQEQQGVHQQEPEFEERHPGEFWSVRCHGVEKSFGSNQVLRGLDFSIPEGLITVVLGPSGTGKSVLINHLIGLTFPDVGEVVVHGESLADMRRSRLNEKRKEFGVLFQDGALFGSLSMYDNVAFPLRQHTDLDEDEIRERVDLRLGDVGLLGHKLRMPNELSGGMKKRAGFARALMLDPSIVLFDEPDSGLDPVRTGLLCELIRATHDQYGGTYVVITHDIASARQVGDYIAVLWKGRIVQAGSAERMLASSNPFVRQFLNRGLDGPLGME